MFYHCGMTFSSPYKIMITGAGGFIGSRLSCYFKNKIPAVRIYDVVRQGATETEYICVQDLSDHDSVRQKIHDIRPDLVIHTAAVTSQSVGLSDGDYARQNVENSKVILDALSEIGCDGDRPALIFSSTVAVYGTPVRPNGYVYEGDDLCPQNPYAQSKVDFENLLKVQDKVRYAILRYANIPGKDSFMNFILKNNQVTFYGQKPYVRDYIHIDDLCDLHGRVVAHFRGGGHSLILNAGAGVGVSFPDLVDEIERQTGVSIQKKSESEQENAVLRVICDMQRAKDILDWQPIKTQIKDIVAYALQNSECISQTPYGCPWGDLRPFGS